MRHGFTFLPTGLDRYNVAGGVVVCDCGWWDRVLEDAGGESWSALVEVQAAAKYARHVDRDSGGC